MSQIEDKPDDLTLEMVASKSHYPVYIWYIS